MSGEARPEVFILCCNNIKNMAVDGYGESFEVCEIQQHPVGVDFVDFVVVWEAKVQYDCSEYVLVRWPDPFHKNGECWDIGYLEDCVGMEEVGNLAEELFVGLDDVECVGTVPKGIGVR